MIKLIVLLIGFSCCGARFDAFQGKNTEGDISLEFDLIPNSGIEISDNGEYHAWLSNTPDAYDYHGFLKEEDIAVAINNIRIKVQPKFDFALVRK